MLNSLCSTVCSYFFKLQSLYVLICPCSYKTSTSITKISVLIKINRNGSEKYIVFLRIKNGCTQWSLSRKYTCHN